MAADPPADDHELDAWLADARAEEAARSRSRERWLRQQDEEGSTFAGVLVELVEAAAPVTLVTTTGRRHTGRLRQAGADFVALEATSGAITLVAHRALAHVRPTGRLAPLGAAVDRHAPSSPRLAGMLSRAAAERPRVAVDASAEQLVGELRVVGEDLLMVLADGEPPRPTYVRLASVCAVSFLESLESLESGFDSG